MSDARTQCEQLIARYHRLIDDGAASEATSLFTCDAILQVAATTARGAAAIADVLTARQERTDRTTIHAPVGFDFEQSNEHDASAVGALILFAGDSGPIGRVAEALCRYRASFRYDEGAWRISALRVDIVSTTDGAT
jgi:hypothetical protein